MSYYEEAKQLLTELLQKRRAELSPETLLVIGCSSSEIDGGQIGHDSNFAIGEQIAQAAVEVCKDYGINLAAQCCEHLNRALIVERAVAKAKGYEIVSVVPKPKAGGSFATAVFERMSDPVAVEEVRADLGLDIGQTMIGMHLKKVAVPLRLSQKQLGEAIITAAYTRPKLIGGERAQYQR